MIYDNIEFHNVAELKASEGLVGLQVQRIPETLRMNINEGSADMMLSPVANVELRFILEDDSVELKLSKGNDAPLWMTVAWGGFHGFEKYELEKEAKDYKLTVPEYYKDYIHKAVNTSDYHPRMVRIMFGGYPEATLFYHGHSRSRMRAPQKSESPEKTLLVYGTSITHGFLLSGPHLSYPYQTARALGMDLINLGSSGSAYCEKEFADYIADRKDWDIAVLSISVNMYLTFDLPDFYERIDYMVTTIARRNRDKPVYCITLFPFFDDVGIYHELSKKNPDGYRQALRDVVNRCGMENVHLIEGSNLLDDFSLLAPDLIHPSDLGAVRIAKKLSEVIR